MQVDIRPMTVEDRPAVTALLGELAREPPAAAGRMLGFLDKLALVHLVAEVGGVVVGRSNLARTPMMQADTVALNVGVTSAARRQGVGSALFDRTAEHVPPGTRRLLAFTDDRDDDFVLDWLAERHFTPFQHSIKSSLDLPSRPTVPETHDRSGLTVDLVDPESTADDEGVAALYEESDTSPEASAIGTLTWLQQLEGARTFGTEGLLVLVREAGRPVAMSLAQQAEGDRWSVLYTGVRPADRGRALGRHAKVLLHDALAARGVRRLDTDNEAANAGIRHVNEQLGYRRAKGSRRHQRDLTVHPLP